MEPPAIQFPAMTGTWASWWKVEGLWRAAAACWPARGQGRASPAWCGTLRPVFRQKSRRSGLFMCRKQKKTRRSGSFVPRAFSCGGKWRRVMEGCWLGNDVPFRDQGSPRCLSSQRSSRLLMNELLGFPDFRAAPAALDFPAPPRMVA